MLQLYKEVDDYKSVDKFYTWLEEGADATSENVKIYVPHVYKMLGIPKSTLNSFLIKNPRYVTVYKANEISFALRKLVGITTLITNFISWSRWFSVIGIYQQYNDTTRALHEEFNSRNFATIFDKSTKEAFLTLRVITETSILNLYRITVCMQGPC